MIDTVLSTMENEEQRNELAVFYSRYKERLCVLILVMKNITVPLWYGITEIM